MLKQRNFGAYFSGNLLSNCGTWFQNIAQTLLVYRLTHSTLLVGVVNFAQFVGLFLLAPWSGSAADRFDRRRLLIVTQVGAVVVTALLAALSKAGVASAPVVIGLALVLGLTTAFAIPALQALVPLLVTNEDLPSAIALSSVSFTLARAIGPALGAVVVANLGIPAAFALNSLSYVALIAALLFIHPRPQAPAVRARPRLRDSVKLLRDDAKLAALLGVIGAISLSQDPVATLTPGFSTEIYHRADTLTGLLVGAFGLGAAVAGVVLAARQPRSDRAIGIACAVMGFGMLTFALSSAVAVGVVALFVGGVGFLASNTISTTRVQLEVEDHLRGRVMALWSVAFLGVRPFGSLVDGAIAKTAGLRTAGVVMAIPAFVAAAAVLASARRKGQWQSDEPASVTDPVAGTNRQS